MVIQRMVDFTKRTGKKTEGFTLVELLIVVAIIAILAAIAIPQFSKYRLRAYKTEIDADSKNAYTAAQAYLTDYPASTITAGMLQSGGYLPSANISVTSSNMTLTGGHIQLDTAAAITDNNSVIFFNGKINQVNSP